jgi:hypothetical protein
MPVAHGGLRGFRQGQDQCEATADPAARATQSLGQGVLLEAVVLRELVEQPAVLERAASSRLVEAVGHDQRVGIVELDVHGEHHVATQRAQSGHA